MAEMDKGLPNTRTKLEVPSQEEIEEVSVQEPEDDKGPIEVIPEEDGGVTLDFEPGAINVPGTENHFDNLADILPDDILNPIGSEMVSNYLDYKSSRKDWEQSYTQGLDLLGFKYENRTEPFQGASGATHPVLAEAVTQFQAQAYKELLPSDGPVRTQIIGVKNQQTESQSQRVKDYMNYLIMDQMKEYEEEFDAMLFHLPLAGSTFKKIYYDVSLGRVVSKFVPADELVVPYTATSIDDAEAVIHVVKMSENELRKQQVNGFYVDIDLAPPSSVEQNSVEKKEKELDGTKKTGKQETIYTLLECHVNLDLEGFEDQGQEGPTGIKLPYIVTVEEGTRKILSIRRNYEIGDPNKKTFDREMQSRDITLVNGLFCESDDLSIYNRLLEEVNKCDKDKKLWKMWHGDSHFIVDDKLNWKEDCPTFGKIIKKIEDYFQMNIQATRFNWYENSSHWKPFHHDAAAIKPHIAAKQNFTVGISFGAERDAAFENAKNKTVLSIPLPNGSIYCFAKDVNIMWKHGILQTPHDKKNDNGRISIIAWGKNKQIDI